MDQHLDVFVFVKGLGTSFPVTIKRSETVGHLKRAIWEMIPNRLKNNDSFFYDLTLYHVDLPDGEGLEQLASEAPKEKLAIPSLKLSKVFPTNPPKHTVSILVEVPNIGK
jgi:hypothetical protein